MREKPEKKFIPSESNHSTSYFYFSFNQNSELGSFSFERKRRQDKRDFWVSKRIKEKAEYIEISE